MRLVFLLFVVSFRVTIPAVAVLSVHKRLRPSVSTDCNYIAHNFGANAINDLVCIHSDCYTRPDRAIIPQNVVLSVLRTSESRRWDIYVFSPLGVRSQAGFHNSF